MLGVLYIASAAVVCGLPRLAPIKHISVPHPHHILGSLQWPRVTQAGFFPVHGDDDKYKGGKRVLGIYYQDPPSGSCRGTELGVAGRTQGPHRLKAPEFLLFWERDKWNFS